MTTKQLRGAPRRVESWIFDNVTSRNALIGATIDDLGRIGYQQDTGTYWRLISIAPLGWEAVGSASVETGTGDLHYRHVQMSASTSWVIVHSLSKYPSVSIIDSTGATVFGTITYDSGDQVTVTFSAAISGEAYLN